MNNPNSMQFTPQNGSFINNQFMSVEQQLNELQKFKRFSDKLFKFDYTPQLIDSLMNAIDSLKVEEQANVWLRNQTMKDNLLGPIKQRIAKGKNKQQMLLISTLYSAFKLSRFYSLQTAVEINALKKEAQDQTKVDKTELKKLEFDLQKLRAQKQQQLYQMEQIVSESQNLKYYLKEADILLAGLKLPESQRQKASEIASYVEQFQKEERESLDLAELESFKNQMNESLSPPSSIYTGSSFNTMSISSTAKLKKNIAIYEIKAQKYGEILSDLVPALC